MESPGGCCGSCRKRSACTGVFVELVGNKVSCPVLNGVKLVNVLVLVWVPDADIILNFAMDDAEGPCRRPLQNQALRHNLRVPVQDRCQVVSCDD